MPTAQAISHASTVFEQASREAVKQGAGNIKPHLIEHAAVAIDKAEESGRRRGVLHHLRARARRLKDELAKSETRRDGAPLGSELRAEYNGLIMAYEAELQYTERQINVAESLWGKGAPKIKPITDEELAKLTGDDAAPRLRQPEFVIEIPRE